MSNSKEHRLSNRGIKSGESSLKLSLEKHSITTSFFSTHQYPGFPQVCTGFPIHPIHTNTNHKPSSPSLVTVHLAMRLDIPAIIAAMAATIAADRLEVHTRCAPGSCDSRSGIFYTDFGSYSVDANEGCRGTSVPGMTEFCMDWGRRRGHFRFSHQGNKRCLTQDSETKYGCDDANVGCWKTTWRELPCNWREVPVPEEELATESAAPSAATTLLTAVKGASN